MNQFFLSSKISTLVAVGASFVTVFITFNTNADPFNVPKMFTLVVLSFMLFGVYVSAFGKNLRLARIIRLSFIFMLIGFAMSMMFSKSPFLQQLYGTSGRNTGILTYLSFLMLFVVSTTIIDHKHLSKFVYAIFFAASINGIYGLFQISGNEFADWKNPYNSFIGTLGNPNFAAAFMAMAVLAALPVMFSQNTNNLTKVLLIIFISVGIIEIFASNAVQGVLILVIGLFVYLLFIIRQKNISPILYYGVLTSGFTIGIFSIFGMLQMGPFHHFLYKPSVTLRGFYWNAGISMFKSSPIFGLGFDSYGDYYTSFRNTHSILPPGAILTVSNSAHNVYIDILSSGGLLVFLPYFVLNAYAALLVIKKFQKGNLINKFEQSLVLAWIGYLSQSLISINQIGIAIWGWIIPGVLIGLNKNVDENITKLNQTKNFKNELMPASSYLVGAIFGLVGLLIVLPAQISDINWLKARNSHMSVEVIKAAKSFPLSSSKLSQAALLLLNNGFKQESLEISKLAISFNPRDYNSWIAYINNPETSLQEKIIARKTLGKLDPLDKRWLG